jgi:mono/diheme cytochrome c family protein
MKSTIYKLFFLFALATIPFIGSAQDAADTALGEKLFKANCAQCHAYDAAVVVGPGLKGINERRDYAWLKSWIQNPAAVLASGDKYANDLYLKYNKTAMTAFPGFGDAEIKGILAYIDQANIAAAEALAAAPAPVAGGGDSGSGSGGGQFFNIVLIALLVIMALVLVALLAVLGLLTKIAGVDQGVDGAEASFADTFKSNVQNVLKNKTVITAAVVLFALMGAKATFDGLYSIGVHQGYAPTQPIAFSHKLHAGEMEINCAYCHTGVYKGKQAGIPSSNICMNCHNEIKRESPEIQKIYTAALNDQPVEWVRVHNLPDLAYFNHSQHTNVAGLDCDNCHGEINKMEVVQQRKSLTMGWCIDCHRKTEVNGKDNAYYDGLMEAHNATYPHSMKVEDIGGLECAKCHY